ncbi:hypothetical protein Esi_0080_0083 [Ectocarpus siliculosus]|uniref:Uncharacterized protein n=1 Tax=Ectocarpus siliculosus TaxID=2880 RepID=D7G7C3_ECTSI|nr:hypothetical protein Esi_0080_0083 [Ectocarpus siliculosus]|eukprot:CBJ27674.1 hypothetical protein Esi_0080_0083 [Ectocarpus siliculosus]
MKQRITPQLPDLENHRGSGSNTGISMDQDPWSAPRSCGHSSRPSRSSRDATGIDSGGRLQPSGRSSTLIRTLMVKGGG